MRLNENIGKYNEYDAFKSRILDIKNNDCLFINNDEMFTSLDWIFNLNDKEKQDKVMKTSILIEKKCNEIDRDLPHKVPTIAKLCEMFENHYEEIKDYNEEELTLLSWTLKTYDEPYLSISMFKLDKSIIDEVINKSSNLNDQFKMSCVLIDGVNINDKDFDKNKYVEDSINYLRSTSIEDITDVYDKHDKQLLSRIHY